MRRRPFLDGSCWRHHRSEKARQRGPPAPELPGGPQHRAQVGDVHLHGAHLGGGPGGQQRGAHGLGPAPVPARQAQVQPVVLLQQPLAQRSADATGLDRNGINHTVPSTPVSPVRARRTGSGGRPAAGRARGPHLLAPVTRTTFLISAHRPTAQQDPRSSDPCRPRLSRPPPNQDPVTRECHAPFTSSNQIPGPGMPRLLWRH